MSLQVELLEKNMAKLTIEVDAEKVDKAIDKAYQKSKNKMKVPGFRNGKVPRQVIEKMYGPEVFYEDAVNEMIPDAYEGAAKESKLDIVSQPEIAVVKIAKKEPFVFTATVAVKPEVELGDYQKIEVKKPEIEVTEEEITAELDKVREKNSRLVPVENRAVQADDAVSIDFEGFVDGVPFEGGKGEDYSLKIGSHTFIDNFEDQLIGVNIGDEVDVNVTFPEQYQAKELEGKPALFKVKIKEIKYKELPELDDEFATEVSEFETLDEYKADVKAKLLEKKEEEAKINKENQIIDKLIEESKMDIPEPMIDTQVKQMANDFANRLQSQGISMEQYMQITGMDANKFIEEFRPQALKTIQTRLVLEAVAKAENIEVTDEEIDTQIEEMAKLYQIEADKFKEYILNNEKEQFESEIATRKALDFLVEKAVENN
jgi:trigger factor